MRQSCDRALWHTGPAYDGRVDHLARCRQKNRKCHTRQRLRPAQRRRRYPCETRGKTARPDEIRQSRPGRTRPAAAHAKISVDGLLPTFVVTRPLCLPGEKTPMPNLSGLPALPMERERSPMIRSMTGFGRRQAPWYDGSVTVEMRSVNHRFLEIACRLPRPLSHMEDAFKKAIQQRCASDASISR